MLDPQFESALEQRSAPQGTYVSIREISSRGMIDLRGLAGDRKFMAEAKQILGVDLPKAPRTSQSFGDIKVLWLSTDQWLILCGRDRAPALVKDLQAAFAQLHALVVDVSDMRAIIRLEGERVREVLLKGCSLDLLGGEYPAGTVRRVRFAEIAALLNIVEENVIDLYVFRSYANYAWDFLVKAARAGSEVRVLDKTQA